jgi:23S rRNA G2445 N2-methylase RlmL
MKQTFIAPSCGTGSLPVELAVKVLKLTQKVSEMAREYFSND